LVVVDTPPSPWLQQLGGWAFRQRSWLPVPLALVLVFVSWRQTQSALMAWAGAVLVVAGLLIRMWGVRHIGTISRTRATRQGPLITSGPYGHVRNPLYVGNGAVWTGFVLLSGLWWMLPIAWIVFAVEYGAIAAWEEARLRAHYGAEYEAYAQVVNRWIPGPGRGGVSPDALHPWNAVLFSERGTLIAAVVMTVLLVVKRALV